MPTPSKDQDAVTKAEKALNDKIEADPDADTTVEEAALKAAKAALVTSDGDDLQVDDFTGTGFQAQKKGLYALESVDLFNLLCLPPYKEDASGKPGDVDKSLIAKANAYCEKRRALLLVDPPSDWTDKDKAKAGITTGVGAVSKNAAIFFPRVAGWVVSIKSKSLFLAGRWQESWRALMLSGGSGKPRPE